MSHKTYVEGGGGIYYTVPTRGPLKGKTVYSGRVWMPSRKRFVYHKLGATTLRQAKRYLTHIAADPDKALAARVEKTEKPMLFDALVETFLAEYRSRGGSDYYTHRAKAWLSYFTGWQVRDIDFKAVEHFREFRRGARYRQGMKGKSRRPVRDCTLRQDIVSLGTLFRWSMKRRLVASNPVQDVARPPKSEREVVVLTRDDEPRLLDAADPQTRTVIDLFLASGMRRGEGLDLRWPKIDRAGEAILIDKSKTGKARSIPLNARLTAVLARATRHVRSDHVLCDREGKALDPYVVTRSVQSAMERAGITKTPGAVFNLLRHTFGSRLAEQGHGFGSIAAVMGNSAAVCEKHYIRFSPGHLKAMMATLDRDVTAPQTAPRSPHGDLKGVTDTELIT